MKLPESPKGDLAQATSLPADINSSKLKMAMFTIVIMMLELVFAIARDASTEMIYAIAFYNAPIVTLALGFIGVGMVTDSKTRNEIVKAKSAENIEAVRSGNTGDLRRTEGGQ